MSPLEVARAFDAPLLRNTDPNGEVSDLLRASGAKKVRYEGGVAAPIEVAAAERDQLSKELGTERSRSDLSTSGETVNSSLIGLVPLSTAQRGDGAFEERGDSLGYGKA